MTFAANTEVSIERSRLEIERTLKRYGADRFGVFHEKGRAMIVFECRERRMRFDVPLPGIDAQCVTHDPAGRRRSRGTNLSAVAEQFAKARWRALLLCIKAKLEAVESGIETFDEAFLAHVVLPDGSTVAEYSAPKIAAIYSSGSMAPLLPPPRPSGD